MNMKKFELTLRIKKNNNTVKRVIDISDDMFDLLLVPHLKFGDDLERIIGKNEEKLIDALVSVQEIVLNTILSEKFGIDEYRYKDIDYSKNIIYIDIYL